MSSLIRPLDGLIVATVMGLSAIGIGGRRLKVSSLALLALGTALVGGIALPYNRLLTGSLTASPLMAYFDKYYGAGKNDLGFGANRGLGWQLDPYPGHTQLEAAINANLNATSVNTEMHGWSTGSVLLIALFLFSGALQKRDLAPVAVIVLVVAAYSLYWFSGGPDFGARYWYLMILPCVLLSARGFLWLWDRLDGYAAPALAAVTLMALVNFFPWRAIDKYARYVHMRPDVQRLAAQHDFRNSLVLIRGERFPDYASAAIYNPIDLNANTAIYVWDQNPEVRRQALEAYPDRPVWILAGPTITGAGFRIAAGPVKDHSQLR